MTALRRMELKSLSGSAAVLAFVLGAPALAQNSDAPVDVTAAPPPSAETVGPSQLRDFSLQGTVTRPADQPAASTAPTTQVPPRTTAPAAAAPAVPVSDDARRSPGRAPVAQADSATVSQLPSPDTVATPSTPLEVTTDPAPMPIETTVAPSATPLPSEGGFLSWPWLVSLLALIGGGVFLAWSRRGRRQRYGDPGRMAFAGLVPDVAPEAKPIRLPQPQPRPDPPPPRAQPTPAAPKPVPQNDGLIVSTGLKPALNVQFQPDRAVVTENEVLLQFDVLLVNSGSAPARDVLVEGRLVSAHVGQDQEIAAFFQNPVGQGDRIAAIPPLGRVSLKSAVRLPIAQLHSFEAAGRKLFVPLVAFNILFRSNGSEGHASASFLVGRGSDGDEKLAPFRLDLGPRIFRGLSARPHSMGLQQA